MKTKDLLNAIIQRSDAYCYALETVFNNGTRIDMWRIKRDRNKFLIQCLELKVSRSDFRHDSWEKQQAAFNACNEFYYVAPKGVIPVQEIPSWAGLLEYDEASNRLRTTIKAPYKELQSSWDILMRVLQSSSEVKKNMLWHNKILNRTYDKLLTCRKERNSLRRNNVLLRSEIDDLRQIIGLEDQFDPELYQVAYSLGLQYWKYKQLVPIVLPPEDRILYDMYNRPIREFENHFLSMIDIPSDNNLAVKYLCWNWKGKFSPFPTYDSLGYNLNARTMMMDYATAEINEWIPLCNNELCMNPFHHCSIFRLYGD